MTRIVLAVAIAFTTILFANSGYVDNVQPLEVTQVQVTQSQAVHKPLVGIVGPGSGPTYIVSPLKVNIPLGPLVFPNVADVPEHGILKSPPLRLVQKFEPEAAAVEYGAPSEHDDHAASTAEDSYASYPVAAESDKEVDNSYLVPPPEHDPDAAYQGGYN